MSTSQRAVDPLAPAPIEAAEPRRPHRLQGVLFQPIGDEGRAELVERRLVDAITRGHLSAGERLPTEADLSKSLGVAPVTVREALLALRERGLVITRRGRNGGSFVAQHADPLSFAREAVRKTSRVALRDMGAHYAAITGACVRLAARRADASEARQVRRRMEHVGELDGDARRRLLDDVQIELVALSQSARLTREQMKLQGEISPFLRLVAHADEGCVRQAEHLRSVIDAVEAADPEAASARTETMVLETVDRPHPAPSPTEGRHMTTGTDTAARDAATIVEEYFASPIRSLLAWVTPFAEQVAAARRSGPLTSARIDALVEPHALATLSLTDVPVYGAGFIAAIDLLADAHSHLAWWQGEDRRQLVLAAQSVNKENIDYSALEWYRVPMATGEPHIAGPYVDYLCSDDYTMTIAAPAAVDGERIGVAGLDLLVASVEHDLTPRFAALGHEVTLINGVGRVIVSTDTRCATGDSVRGSRLADLPRVTCAGVALDVIVEGI
ncbi:GntR family transcriptional regulator [Microbacterium sp. W4I20]|uniref:GntR family transcriptional regulator n=1 Tax=Microbacterium sp. W4I20 TaxID=3042262 RepID=UPI0027D7DB42|nr:GntR family transcriptional regulator [Microbacterium sp. W4I20]